MWVLDKSELIENRIRDRNEKNTSILDSMGFDYPSKASIEIQDSNDEVTIKDKPAVCCKCFGRGVVKPMFYYIECAECFGTGYDLSNPLSIIKWQKLCLKWSKTKITSLQNEVRKLKPMSDEEKQKAMGFVMDRFYENSKRLD